MSDWTNIVTGNSYICFYVKTHHVVFHCLVFMMNHYVLPYICYHFLLVLHNWLVWSNKSLIYMTVDWLCCLTDQEFLVYYFSLLLLGLYAVIWCDECHDGIRRKEIIWINNSHNWTWSKFWMGESVQVQRYLTSPPDSSLIWTIV